MVSLQTTRCMASSGVIHGPPLEDHPSGELFNETSIPKRPASAMACPISSRHSGTENLHRTRQGIGDIKDDRAPDARCLHGFEIGRNSCAGDIPPHPIP
jgi:hypothetical protein